MSGERMRGGVNTVVRAGNVVHRPAGSWTPAVHAFLRHLADAGFTAAPKPHGDILNDLETVDFIPGEVPAYPMPGYVRSDATVRKVAELLRAFHDATAGFTPPHDAQWYLPAREPAEVICHGDIAPYNCVFRDGEPVAFIDFDTAHPGPRVWDVSYAVYRFVPLTSPDNPDTYGSVAEQARRLRLFCDTYQLGARDRQVLLATVQDRLRAMIEHIRAKAAEGNEAFAAHLAAGHVELYLADLAYVAKHAPELATD